MTIPRRNKEETDEEWEKREKKYRRRIDSLITVLEPVEESIYREHYNLPLSVDMRDIDDLDIRVDNRRWLYLHGRLDEDGEIIESEEEEENTNSMDWIEPEDTSWMPEGPDFKIGQKALNELMMSGEMMSDEKTKQRLLAQAADAEIRDMLSQAEKEY